MAAFEIRMMKEDIDEDSLDEVLIEFYYRADPPSQSEPPNGTADFPQSVSVVYYSPTEGRFNKVSGRTDVGGAQGYSVEDDQLLIDLATAFSKLSADAFK